MKIKNVKRFFDRVTPFLEKRPIGQADLQAKSIVIEINVVSLIKLLIDKKIITQEELNILAHKSLESAEKDILYDMVKPMEDSHDDT